MPGVCFCQDLDIDYISHFNFTCTRCAANLPSTTIKRLSFKRRPRGASDHEETNVADSLSNKRGTREVATQGRPPLPPPHASTDKKTSRSKNKLPDTEATQGLGEKDKLDVEVTSPPTPPQPLPRRRLASFGGLSSPDSSSIFTGLGAYSQFKGGQHPAATGNISACSGSSLGSTQSLKVSPHSSGRSTPVTGSVQLQNVRDQMVAALQKLKELEEEVKIIPALELNISELQEEKKILSFELEKHRKQDPDALWKTDDGCVLCCEHQCQSKGKEITTDLGNNTEKDDLLSIQQEFIYSLKERICYLEAELKESALQIEMNRLKLELQAAEQRHLKKMDKASSAVPSTADSSTEARPSTTSQGVGNHVTVCDASAGEVTPMKSVRVSCCMMKLQNVRAGPGVQWVVREMVETADKNTGVQIPTTSQGVGTCIKLCDTGSNTDKLWSDNDQWTDEGRTASPETASQDTNTVRNLVSRFTNTKQPFNTDSITNTVIKSQDKHTNTPATVTRTVSVGSRVQDIQPPTQTRTIGVGTSHCNDNDTQNPNCKLTRDASVGFINIHENFLIGIKTRNMASGPSHLPDPFKTRSVGVGDGRIRESPTKERSEVVENQSMKDTELNFYIEEMERFLMEHKDLLKEDAMSNSNQHESSPRNASPTQHGKITQEGNGEVVLDPTEQTNLESRGMCPEDDNCTGAKPNEVKRMIKMLEKQTWNSLEDKATKDTNPWSVCKRKNTEQSCSTSRRNMRLMGVTTRLEPISSSVIDAVEMMGKNDSANIKKSKGGRNDKLSSRKLLKAPARHSIHESSFRVKLSDKMQNACQNLMMHLSEDKQKRTKDCKETIQTLKQEWFNITAQRSAAPGVVEDYLCALREVSPVVLQHVVNMADGNGNTALHYCVSNSNFAVVQRLLNTDVCSVNQQNKAGYTPIMLAALAALASPEDMSVVKELFSEGNVNAKASQAGQTALMLASSHGSLEMVKALLEQGAEVNLQDDEGSTALMCASEHGHQDIVKLLLQQPHCDATLTDGDDSTALSIALEGGHKEIAVLLYAHANFSKGNTGNSCPASPSPPGRRKCL